MSTFLFGPWRPDIDLTLGLPDGNEAQSLSLNAGELVLAEASNVFPDPGGYQPHQQRVFRSASLSRTCQGAFALTDQDGQVNWFAGTAESIYRCASNTATANWATVGTGYALTEEDRWEFAQYGNQIYATAVTQAMQYMTLSAGSVMQPVAGGAPRARHIAVVRNFLVVAGTDNDPQLVHWSALDNPQSWDADATTQADSQDLAGDGGWNQGIVVGLPGSDAVIFQERAVWRMMYVGTPLIFQFDQVEGLRGAVSPGSIVQSGGLVFYRSDDGFYQFDGMTSQRIGHGKVDQWFVDHAELGEQHRISAAADAARSLVWWSFKSTSGANPDQVLVYNWKMGEWSHLVNTNVDLIWRPLSLSDPFGAQLLGAFHAQTHQAATFTGSNTAPIIETRDHQFNPNGHCLVTEVYPLIEAGDPTTVVKHRNRMTDSNLVSHSPVAMNAFGFAPVRVDGRYMRIRHAMPFGSDWRDWRGIKITFRPTGRR